MSDGSISWILTSAALVMLMTPGLAIFYGGLVRRKNVVSIMMQNYITLAVISVLWVVMGYTLAFGPDVLGLVGGLEFLMLRGVGSEPSPYASTIPHLAFAIYQGMFAAITPALITGAFAERMKFSSYLLFLLLWATLVYSPVAHWVWGGGWLGALGALDFAGGTVVHINSGMAALVAALVIGRRQGFGALPIVSHNIPLVVLGTALLWFGWFGFNAGSALAANTTAVMAFATTNTAAATATVTWVVVEWLRKGAPSVVGAASGAIAGLVAITPAAGFVDIPAALVIGFGAGLACYGAILFKNSRRLDDALDVWGIHGVGGIWGALATGIFATELGLIAGNPYQLLIQGVGVAATAGYSAAMTWLILKVVDRLIGLRVPPKIEEIGLDVALHAEEAYR
jgi:Amt family ammonium transporter